MFGLAGRRLAEGIVALFALLGFAFVPLGRKTALEHARDIFTTDAAITAFREVGTAVERLRAKLVSSLLLPPSEPPSPPPAKSGPKPELPAIGPERAGKR